MNESDLTRLRHMRDAAREVIAFTEGESRESLDEDIMLVRALSMSIAIIGEAASRLSQTVRDENPQVPWRAIIGMRNFLIHAYHNVDLKVVWDTATTAIPDLLEQLEVIIPPENK